MLDDDVLSMVVGMTEGALAVLVYQRGLGLEAELLALRTKEAERLLAVEREVCDEVLMP